MPLLYMNKPLPITRGRGRPAGTTKASGAKVSPGRPAAALTPHEQERLRHWRKWWAARQKQHPSATVLAARMEHAASTVREYGNGRHDPSAATLLNLETLSAAYGYQPLVFDPLL